MKIPASTLMAVLLTVAAMYFASVVLLPLVLALCFAILLDPLVAGLENRRVPRALATPVVVFTFLAFMVVLTGVLYEALGDFLLEIPAYKARLQFYFAEMNRFSHTWNSWTPAPLWSSAPGAVVQKVEVVERYPAWFGLLFRGLSSVFGLLSLALFVPLLIYFLLLEKHNLKEAFNTLAGRHLFLPRVDKEVPQLVRYFFIGHLLVGLALAFLHWVLFALLGLNHAVDLALVTGYLNLFPLIGAPVAIGVAILQGLLQWQTLPPFVVLTCVLFALHFVAANIVLPRILGKRINVNSVTILMGFLFWGWIWGGLGFLLAIPLTAAVKILLASNPSTQPWANLLAAKIRPVVGRRRQP